MWPSPRSYGLIQFFGTIVVVLLYYLIRSMEMFGKSDKRVCIGFGRDRVDQIS